MSVRGMVFWSVLFIAAMFAYSLWLYPSLPDRVPTHWNWKGEVDGWSSKPFGAFFLPGMTAGLWLLFLALPWLSPRGFKVEPFRATYNILVVMVLALMAYIHFVALQAALQPNMDMARALIGGIFALFGGIGVLLGRVKRNFWVGVRTPWTLASDAVWDSTHRLAARLYSLTGFGCALAVFAGVPTAVCFVMFITLIFVPVVYSLVLYKRLEKQGTV